MKVWKDLLSGDEMISDSFPQEMEFNDAMIVVKSKFVTKKKNEDFGISGKFSFPAASLLFAVF